MSVKKNAQICKVCTKYRRFLKVYFALYLFIYLISVYALYRLTIEKGILFMAVKIFAMTHKEFDVPKDAMYIPLHVGHKQAKLDFGYRGDDTGDNISGYGKIIMMQSMWESVIIADF